MGSVKSLGERVVSGLSALFDTSWKSPHNRERVTAELDSLLHRLKDRLSEKDYQWAIENSGQTEWELAVVAIYEAVRRGELALSSDESAQLARIERQIDRRMVRQLLGGRKR